MLQFWNCSLMFANIFYMFYNLVSIDFGLYYLIVKLCYIFTGYFSIATIGSVNDASLRLNRIPSVFVIDSILGLSQKNSVCTITKRCSTPFLYVYWDFETQDTIILLICWVVNVYEIIQKDWIAISFVTWQYSYL